MNVKKQHATRVVVINEGKYLRLEDVVEMLFIMSENEEHDVAERIRETARNLLSSVSKVKVPA